MRQVGSFQGKTESLRHKDEPKARQAGLWGGSDTSYSVAGEEFNIPVGAEMGRMGETLVRC